jgi:alpha-beta hydrolase superfamily lysophospholipase
MEPKMFSWYNAEGLKLVGQEWRPEGAPRAVVALVHGIGEHMGRYRHIAEALNRADIGMIGFDLAGHGQSEGIRGHTSYDSTLDEIDHLLRQAASRYPELPRFLYGHSLGGVLALYYALKRRPKILGFIVTSPGIIPTQASNPGRQLLARVVSAIKPSFTLGNGLDANNLSHDTAVVQAYKTDPLNHPRVSGRLGLDLLTKGAWIIDHAADFPGPLLLMQGSEDRLVQPQATRAFAEKIPADRLTYKEWDGMYHEIHNETQKADVIQSMIDWIEDRI